MSHDFAQKIDVSVTIPSDENGFTGRECPKCEKVFKIKDGTGLKGTALPCHCPYCGHTSGQDQFYTKGQIEYAKSVVLRQITDLLHTEFKKIEFNHPPRGPFGIGISLEVAKRSPHPIRYVYEESMETDVVCDKCELSYAIYGEFAFCPSCRSHNSLTILQKNIEFAGKMLVLADSQEREISERVVGDALENLVSAFDGFGREVCRVAAPNASDPNQASDIRFQNLVGAQIRVQKLFNVDLCSFISPADWAFTCQCFQKRHLLAHKLGVVDEDYLKATGDPAAILGRKISIAPVEVKRLGTLVAQLGGAVTQHLLA